MMMEWAMFPYKASEEAGVFQEMTMGWYIRYKRTSTAGNNNVIMYFDDGRVLTKPDGRPASLAYACLTLPTNGSLGTVKFTNQADPMPMNEYLRKPSDASRGSRTRIFTAEGDKREYCWSYRTQGDEPDIIWRCTSKEGYEWAVFTSPPPGETQPPTFSINPTCENIVKDLFLSLHVMLYMQKNKLF